MSRPMEDMDTPANPLSHALSPDRVTAFDDLKVGDRYDFGFVTFHKDDIIEFARKFDPQPFHLDEADAKGSMFGGLVASGLHTLSAVHAAAVTQGFLGRAGRAGIAFRDARFLLPVRPGDTLHVTVEVMAVRKSGSKPDRGYVTLKYIVENQHRELVLRLITDGLFHRRDETHG